MAYRRNTAWAAGRSRRCEAGAPSSVNDSRGNEVLVTAVEVSLMIPGYDWLLNSCGLGGDAQSFLQLGTQLQQEGELHLAATAYDRAFGLEPHSESITRRRL